MKKEFIQLSFCGTLLALSCCGFHNDRSQTENGDKDSIPVTKVDPGHDRFLARALDTTNHSFVPVVETSDYLFWNGQKYLMCFSPLHSFKGYRDLYPDLPFTISCMPQYATQGRAEKRYAAVWIVQNDSIYLADIDFYPLYLETFPPQEKLPPPKEKLIGIMEKFLGAKFQTDRRFDKSLLRKDAVQGVIPAKWVNGWIYIKRIQRIKQETWAEWNKEVPFLILKFRKGKLLSVEEVGIK